MLCMEKVTNRFVDAIIYEGFKDNKIIFKSVDEDRSIDTDYPSWFEVVVDNGLIFLDESDGELKRYIPESVDKGEYIRATPIKVGDVIIGGYITGSALVIPKERFDSDFVIVDVDYGNN